MDKWKDYLFLLIEGSSKENEVTGEEMGGKDRFVSLPLSKYKAGTWIKWKPLHARPLKPESNGHVRSLTGACWNPAKVITIGHTLIM